MPPLALVAAGDKKEMLELMSFPVCVCASAPFVLRSTMGPQSAPGPPAFKGTRAAA